MRPASILIMLFLYVSFPSSIKCLPIFNVFQSTNTLHIFDLFQVPRMNLSEQEDELLKALSGLNASATANSSFE
jgi:hypothetical protein